jgi:hypothetical protein
MTITGTQEAMKDRGVKAVFDVGVPSTFGVGTQTFKQDPYKPPTFKIYQKGGNNVREATKEEVEKMKADADKIFQEELQKAMSNKGWGYNKYNELTLSDDNIVKKGDYNKLSEDDKKKIQSRIKSSASQKAKEKFKY